MIGSGSGATTPYSNAARARLVMAYEACLLAELARAAVPIGEQELHPDGTIRAPGTELAHAAQVLALAERFFEAAAVFERVGGAGWQVIGDVLDVPPETARMRFAESEATFWRLLHPVTGAPASLRAHMVREPLEFALDLDDWVLRHRDGDSDLGPAPVSGGLVRSDPRR
ncbi:MULTISPECIES: hypothetical protein [Amycolatopsis]|uniref:Uncharacterized protein n=1 Tax=Amycolatopsis bullii TaxID=941987 RepID=A0ABQ3KK91_9PSEU|nr:hypothetical protein [Amycolatopsis bullii]GHG32048.1 hypothetical protein GCM10017567_60250 [Amycolatopsis bullii]